MSSTLRGGLAYIKVDGRQYDLRADCKYKTGDLKRETLAGMDKIHGYKEMKEAPYIEGTFSDAADLDTKAFQAMTNVTVTLELGNGKQAIFRNAWCMNAVEVDASEGSFSLRFEALEAEEIPVSGN